MPTSLQQRRLVKEFKRKQRELAIVDSNSLKPLPNTWLEFAQLLKIKSGGKIVTFNPYPYQVKIVEEYVKQSTLLAGLKQFRSLK